MRISEDFVWCFFVFCICSVFVALAYLDRPIEKGECADQIQTIKAELAYHEKYLQALDANATMDRIKNKQTKQTVDFIYNGLGGDKHLGGWE